MIRVESMRHVQEQSDNRRSCVGLRGSLIFTSIVVVMTEKL